MNYTKEMNIYERMSEIENQLGIIAKDMEIGSGKNAYKAVGEATVLNAVKPLEYQYRIKSLPIKREVVKQECYETVLEGYTKRLFFISIKTTFRFVNLDNTSEFVDVESLGDGTDPLDKGSGKAQTYADKNALLKAYKMISGEDTDNTHSNKYENEQKKDYKEVKQNAILKGKLVIDKELDLPANLPYRDEAIKNVCAMYGWKSWEAITFKNNEEFKKIFALVKQELNTIKTLAQS